MPNLWRSTPAQLLLCQFQPGRFLFRRNAPRPLKEVLVSERGKCTTRRSSSNEGYTFDHWLGRPHCPRSSRVIGSRPCALFVLPYTRQSIARNPTVGGYCACTNEPWDTKDTGQARGQARLLHAIIPIDVVDKRHICLSNVQPTSIDSLPPSSHPPTPPTKLHPTNQALALREIHTPHPTSSPGVRHRARGTRLCPPNAPRPATPLAPWLVYAIHRVRILSVR